MNWLEYWLPCQSARLFKYEWIWIDWNIAIIYKIRKLTLQWYHFSVLQICLCDIFRWYSICYPCPCLAVNVESLQQCHNGRDGVSNHQPHDCLLNGLFKRRSKKTSKLRVTGLCAGIHRGPVNSPQKWPVTRKMFLFDDVIMCIVMLDFNVAFMVTFITHRRNVNLRWM